MPRSNPGQHEDRQSAFWEKLRWWNRDTGKFERQYPFNVKTSPVPMVAEFERRDGLCSLDEEEREKAF